MCRVPSAGKGNAAAAFLILAASLASMARAQEQTPAAQSPSAGTGTLDPSSPLDEMPDIGVDWPDLSRDDGQTAGAPVPERAQQATEIAAEQRYSLAVEGLDDLAPDDVMRLRQRFDALSTLKAGENKPANVAQIDRRAREDAELMAQLLRADGYYSASVEPVVAADAARQQIIVTLDVRPGDVYTLQTVDLPGLDAAGEKSEGLRDAFGVKPGAPADADDIVKGEDALRARIGADGFPFAQVSEPELIVDHETRTARLKMDVEPGEAKRFGTIRMADRRIFGPRHVMRIARFETGQPYDARMIEDLRRALIATGLVSSVRIEAVPTGEDVVDIAVAVEPAPPRTVAAEAGYGTGQGIRAELSWQHRNLIRPEGAVTFRGVAGTQEQLIGASLRRSNFRARDQVLTAQASLANINRDAYDARTFSVGAGIERQTNIIWQKTWTWSAGVELLASDERDTVGQEAAPRRRTFLIGALPGMLAYDGTDDLLNPQRGFRLSGRLSPELSLQSGVFGYARAQIDASAYQPVSERVVVAGRVRLGTILGAGRDRIAPSRRFYAGGGGSVRGYGYQDIGPVDPNGDPIGGRSLTEFSLEARVRVGDFGIVPFVDAGNIYTSPLPRANDLRYGAGIGARYYTSFGPIRVDVGTPLNRRSGDPRIAVYVSLGQAF
ncbi:BamA/TamA family outer membrane protein [Sphingomonas sanxanigenens]